MIRREVMQLLGRSAATLFMPTCTQPTAYNAATFRQLNGLVLAFMFGSWPGRGTAVDPSPWYWINRYARDRIPVGSKPLPANSRVWKISKDSPHTYVASPAGRNHVNFDPQTRISAGDEFTISSLPIRSHFSENEFVGLNIHILDGADSIEDMNCTVHTFNYSDRQIHLYDRKIQISPSRSSGLIYAPFFNLSDIDRQIVTGWRLSIRMKKGRTLTFLSDIYERPTHEYDFTVKHLLGLDSESEYASRLHLGNAQKAGVDGFLLCTYWDGVGSRNDATIDSLFGARTSATTKLGLYVDTSASTPLDTEASFDDFARYLSNRMKSRRYLCIDDRPVVGFHGTHSLIAFFSKCEWLGGSNFIDRCKRGLAQLKIACSNLTNRGKEPILLSGSAAAHPDLISHAGAPALIEYLAFDACTSYNQFAVYETSDIRLVNQDDGARATGSVRSRWPQRLETMDFGELELVYQSAAKWITEASASRIRYFVPAICGWNAEPWRLKEARPDSPCSAVTGGGCNPTAGQLEQHFTWARNTAIASARGGLQPVVAIYAWDEFGEGGILCPTLGDRFDKLAVTSSVFGNKQCRQN